MQSFEILADDVSALALASDPVDWDRVHYADGMLHAPEDVAARLRLGDTDVLFAARKTAMLTTLAAHRWTVETGGIMVSGVAIATDDRSKTMIMGARIKAEKDSAHVVRWKTSTGFVDLDAATIIGISDAVLDHVAACFVREGELTEEIAAAETASALEAIDITCGWP